MISDKRLNTKTFVVLAMLSAIAYILASILRIPLVPAVSFLGYEPKDVVLVIAGFLYGPLAPLVMSVTISLIEGFTTSALGPIGIPMNLISSCAFACTASFIYLKKHTLKGAIIGLAIGTVTVTGVMLLWNYALSPILMGWPRSVIRDLLIPGFLPFNLIKGTLNSAITVLLYKPIRKALGKSKLLPVPASSDVKLSKVNLWALLVPAFIILTCAMVVLSMRGII